MKVKLIRRPAPGAPAVKTKRQSRFAAPRALERERPTRMFSLLLPPSNPADRR
jgi:hypothetical protein